jgi:hypothetical protein
LYREHDVDRSRRGFNQRADSVCREEIFLAARTKTSTKEIGEEK